MKFERSPVEFAIAYMLKVVKAGKDTSQFKDEFAAIRHGNYFDFVNLVGKHIEFIVTYNGNTGEISNDVEPNKTDVDFGLLIKSAESCKDFLLRCKKVYGGWTDNDITDETFLNLALFEIAIRMHSNNAKLHKEREKLVNVINLLVAHKGFNELEKERLHKARRFLNMVKGHKNPYSSWQEGLTAFYEGFSVIQHHKILIV